MTASIACACLALLLPSVALSAPLTIEVAIPGSGGGKADLQTVRTWREWLAQQGIAVDRCGYDAARGTIVVDLQDESERRLLLDRGFQVLREFGGNSVAAVQTQSQYFDPTEIATMLTQIAADHPEIARVFTIGTTIQGRSIYAIEISNQPNVDEDEPAIQFNGQHHAREVATSHVVMDIVQSLVNGYGVDSDITQWVDSYTTVCVPMVNPDGVQHVFNGTSSWRRNRKVYPTCTGVDLNRNYPYLWGPGCGSSGSCNDTYRGPSAASELETQAMMGLGDNFHFVMATSYHSFGQFVDYPYACSNGSPSGQMPEHAVIDQMMHGISDGIFAVDGTRYDVFSPVPAGGVNGDDTSWYYAHRGTYAMIIEVGTSFEPPFAQVAGIVNQNRGGWRYLYGRLGGARIDVHVTDSCSGEPITAEVSLTDYVYDTGETPRVAFMPYGRWTYLVMPNDSYTVRASKAGYVTADVPVNVAGSPVSLEIALDPVDPPAGPCATAPIPATSAWALLCLATLLAIAATLLTQRRQSSTTIA